MKKLIYFVLAIILLIPFGVKANEKEINMHLFYGEECPHCEKLIEFLDEYLKEKDNVKLYKYEVWHNKNNQERLSKVQDLLQVKGNGVPYLVIGNQVVTGYYAKYTNQKIKDLISYYEQNDYCDEVGDYLGTCQIKDKDVELVDKNVLTNITVPILGEINPTKISLPILSVVIGLVDGFNPCAMWILLFLITMLINVNNRKRMWILGFSFILTSGIVYLLFMVSWLNLAIFMNKITYIRLLIGLFGVVFGIINIRKYFKTRKDVGCEVVNDNKRKKIVTGIKKITTEKKFLLALLGVILLAVAVNIIELLCSLGLPLIFTQVLSLNNLSSLEYIIYLGLYIIFFLIDDIIIFTIAMKTLKIKAVSNKYTKYSHLIGGIIMAIIGILMIFKLDWLMFNF